MRFDSFQAQYGESNSLQPLNSTAIHQRINIFHQRIISFDIKSTKMRQISFPFLRKSNLPTLDLDSITFSYFFRY